MRTGAQHLCYSIRRTEVRYASLSALTATRGQLLRVLATPLSDTVKRGGICTEIAIGVPSIDCVLVVASGLKRCPCGNRRFPLAGRELLSPPRFGPLNWPCVVGQSGV